MNDTSSDYMALLRPNIRNSWIDKTGVAQSVRDTILSLKPDSQSSIIITQGRFADLPVLTVTEESSAGTEMLVYSADLPIILIEELVGLFLNRSSDVEQRKQLNDS